MSETSPINSTDREQVEAVLLKSILLHPEEEAFVRTVLQPKDFSEDRHHLMYEAHQIVFGTPELDIINDV